MRYVLGTAAAKINEVVLRRSQSDIGEKLNNTLLQYSKIQCNKCDNSYFTEVVQKRH